MINVFKRLIHVTSGDNPGTYYCAGYSRKGTTDSLGLAEEMKDGSSSFTRGEVVGVTLDLPTRIKQALLDGKAVKINGLGTIKPSLTVSKIQADANDLKTSAISIKTLNFAPDSELLTQLNQKAEYEWINASAANEEDASDETNGTDGSDESGSDASQSGGGLPSSAGDTDIEG